MRAKVAGIQEELHDALGVEAKERCLAVNNLTIRLDAMLDAQLEESMVQNSAGRLRSKSRSQSPAIPAVSPGGCTPSPAARRTQEWCSLNSTRSFSSRPSPQASPDYNGSPNCSGGMPVGAPGSPAYNGSPNCSVGVPVGMFFRDSVGKEAIGEEQMLQSVFYPNPIEAPGSLQLLGNIVRKRQEAACRANGPSRWPERRAGDARSTSPLRMIAVIGGDAQDSRNSTPQRTPSRAGSLGPSRANLNVCTPAQQTRQLTPCRSNRGSLSSMPTTANSFSAPALAANSFSAPATANSFSAPTTANSFSAPAAGCLSMPSSGGTLPQKEQVNIYDRATAHEKAAPRSSMPVN